MGDEYSINYWIKFFVKNRRVNLMIKYLSFKKILSQKT